MGSVRGTAVTEEQIAELRRLIDTLGAFISALEDSDGKPQTRALLHTQVSDWVTALQRLVDAIEADKDNIDCTILRAVHRIIIELVVIELEPRGRAQLADLAQVCAREQAVLLALHTLLASGKPVAPEPVASEPPQKTMMAQTCTIVGKKMRLGENGRDGVMFELTYCLYLMRRAGVRQVRFDHAEALPLPELMWLCNTALAVFEANARAWGLVINIPVTVPAEGRTLYVHLTYHLVGTVRIRFENYAMQPKVTSALNIAETKERMVKHFQLARIDEAKDAQWTLPELVQLHNALSKMPLEDRPVLRGCVITRVKTPSDLTESAEAGSYGVHKHTIRLLDGTFADEHGFVGVLGDIAPRSHWVILHEVGHALEAWHWKGEYDKFDSAALDATLRQLEAEKAKLEKDLSGIADVDAYRLKSAEITALGRRISKVSTDSLERKAAQIRMDQEVIANNSPSQCLKRFLDMTKAVNLRPFTPYARNRWGDSRGEFFAEAYTMFLNEPHIMEYMSPELMAWFANGGYRVVPD